MGRMEVVTWETTSLATLATGLATGASLDVTTLKCDRVRGRERVLTNGVWVMIANVSCYNYNYKCAYDRSELRRSAALFFSLRSLMPFSRSTRSGVNFILKGLFVCA